MMYFLLRPFLFFFPPEFSHTLVLALLDFFYPPWRVRKIQKNFPQKPKTLFQKIFPNPVGLAAGFDKNGEHIDSLFGLGFGFIEVGAVTPKPQSGNPKPRLFRLPKAKALINRMGFNNLGVDHLVSQLKKRKIDGILGVNIGKNSDTPLEYAIDDYAFCFRKVYPYADFVTINISSPNTFGLQALQGETYLSNLLRGMKQQQAKLSQKFKQYVPLLIKISSDLSRDEVDVIARLSLEMNVDGVIAVNTSRDRIAVQGLLHADQDGGLSGRPLFAKATEIILRFKQKTEMKIPLIAVGGIFSAEEAKIIFAAGADLVQVYTGLIYQGPRLIRDMVSSL